MNSEHIVIFIDDNIDFLISSFMPHSPTDMQKWAVIIFIRIFSGAINVVLCEYAHGYIFHAVCNKENNFVSEFSLNIQYNFLIT